MRFFSIFHFITMVDTPAINSLPEKFGWVSRQFSRYGISRMSCERWTVAFEQNLCIDESVSCFFLSLVQQLNTATSIKQRSFTFHSRFGRVGKSVSPPRRSNGWSSYRERAFVLFVGRFLQACQKKYSVKKQRCRLTTPLFCPLNYSSQELIKFRAMPSVEMMR